MSIQQTSRRSFKHYEKFLSRTLNAKRRHSALKAERNFKREVTNQIAEYNETLLQDIELVTQYTGFADDWDIYDNDEEEAFIQKEEAYFNGDYYDDYNYNRRYFDLPRGEHIGTLLYIQNSLFVQLKDGRRIPIDLPLLQSESP